MIFQGRLRDLADATLGRLIKRWLVRETIGTVHTGPFRGMKYIDQSFGSSFFPKLLGTYEKELHGVIASLKDRPIRLVVDIGSAEGYYAAGFARLFPQTKVVAFEMEKRGRELTASLAEKNGVLPRMEILGKCEEATLEQALGGTSGALVVCDTEGYERVLLMPSKAPALASAIVLCETHDFLSPGVTEELMARFQDTHHVQVVNAVRRRPEDFPLRPPFWLRCFGPRALTWCLGERRGPDMKWLFCVPRQ